MIDRVLWMGKTIENIKTNLSETEHAQEGTVGYANAMKDCERESNIDMEVTNRLQEQVIG